MSKEFDSGYIQNISNLAYYALKRSIHPGDTVSFSQVYDILKGKTLGYEKDESFIEVIRSKFNDNRIWKVVTNGLPKQNKLRATGGIIETSKDVAEVPTQSAMSRVTGVQPMQGTPEITIEMLLDATTPDKIEELVQYVKSPTIKKRLLNRASEVARTRGGKEGHFRAIEKLREKLMIK